MNIKLYCPDIECESCVKVLTKTFEKLDGIEKFEINQDHLIINFNENKINKEKIISIINEKGFRADTEQFIRKTFSERFRDFTQNKNKYENEYKMLKYSILSLALLIFLEFTLYSSFLRNIPDFLNKFGLWIFYIDLAVISIGSAVWHVNSYKMKIKDMTGMMIGMTFGMQTGMMIGTIIRATNGLFVGSTAGMLLAVIIGFYNGRCSGIMGVMEGMMAGVMGGVMGGMTGAMFVLDYISWFMPLFMLINIIIMFSLSYMLFEEVIEHNPKIEKNHTDFIVYFSYILIFTVLLSLIIIYGPRTGVARL